MNGYESHGVHDLAHDLPTPVVEAPTPTGRWRDLLGATLRPAVLRALRNWQTGRLTVHLPDGTVHAVGEAGAEPHATLRVARDAFFADFVLRGDIGAGESYMAGDWSTDDLPGFIELALLNQQAVGRDDSWITALMNVPNDIGHWLRKNTRQGSRRNIRRHYDLSNDLFALFLDPSMTYSAAVFDSPGEDLTRAQERKFARFGEALRLGPADHVLEIGCGWGAFALYAARTYGCRVTGITISREQLDLATSRVAAAGLGDRVDIRLCDYRDVTGAFDKIVSIEMLEAVGREHWPVFFATCDERLRPGGLVGIQTISMPDHRFEAYARHCDWIQKYIFPGGLLPSISELCRTMAAGTRFTLRRVDDIAPHYATTLARWRATFFLRVDAVRALGFDDRFIRMWDFYLATCEAAFRTRFLGTLQLVVGRAGERPVP
jgi:cyclopropane-fatty-acyl-phospholipid synthase